MKILVCGGRDFGDLTRKKRGTEEWNSAEQQRIYLFNQLDILCAKFSKFHTPPHKDIEIVSGAARGADSAASAYAIANNLKLHEFPADWKRYGPSAGPIRNQQMIDEARPDLVVAFPGKTGTQDMIRRALENKIPVRFIGYRA